MSILLVAGPVRAAGDDSSDNGGTTTSTSPNINLEQLLQQDLGEVGGQNSTKTSDTSNPVETVKTYQPASVTPGAGIPVSSHTLSAVNPDKYRIEPGDTLLIELWTPVHEKLSGVVSPLGTLNIDPVGEVYVQGITLRQFPKALEKSLLQYYRNVKVYANLIDVRSVKVQVLGEVKLPGTYEMTGINGVLDAIGRAGGLTDRASLRDIQIMKDGHQVGIADYFRWRIFGDDTQNAYIEPNEVVYVSVIHNQVMIDGEVRRPGSYEMLPGETYDKLLEMAGGYAPEAVPGEVKISRISDIHSKTNLNVADNIALQNGDTIFVPASGLFEKRIKVIGEVVGAGIFKPGQSRVNGAPELARVGWYRLHDNERVRDVILNLGGLTPAADPNHARVERKTDHGIVSIPVNLHKLLTENDQSQNIALQDGDTLIVPNAPDSVFVIGEVNKPGVQPYTPGNQIREYLTLAGGPASHANMKHAKLVRNVEGSKNPEVYNINLNDILIGGKMPKELLVEPGDVIYVPRSEVTSLSDILNYVSGYALIRALVP